MDDYEERVLIPIDELAVLEIDAICSRLIGMGAFSSHTQSDMCERFAVGLCEWWFHGDDDMLAEIVRECQKSREDYGALDLIQAIRNIAGPDAKVYPKLCEGIALGIEHLNNLRLPGDREDEWFVSDVEMSHTAEAMVFWINSWDHSKVSYKDGRRIPD